MVSEEVEKLLLKQAVKQVQDIPSQFLSNLFLVPKKDGSLRPVINLKPLNHYVRKQKFKMEGAKVLKDILQEGDWMVSIDLKDAYLSVPVAKKDRPFLRFRWKGTLYEFQCLPFGLSSAPRVFTKLMKPVVSLLRRQGVRCIIFLDDLLVMKQTQEALMSTTRDILILLQVLGFRINWEKSMLTPAQVTQFLGLEVNSIQMTVALPDKKLKGIVQCCNQASRMNKITVRDLAQIIGKMSATMLAVLPAPLCYRNLQRLKNQALLTSPGNYEAEVHLDQAAKEELQWWKHELLQWNGRPLHPPSPDLTIETDASLLGWGAVTEGVSTGGLWSEEERQNHINHLELLGAVLAVQTFTKGRKVSHVHLRMDNKTAVCYINRLVIRDVSHCLPTVGMVSQQWTDSLSRVPPREGEHCSGPRVADAPDIGQMDAGQFCVSQSDVHLRPMQGGPVCIETELSTSPLHQLASRPVLSGNRRIPGQLEESTGVCFSPIFPDREVPQENTTRGFNSGSDSPCVAIPSLVSLVARDDLRNSCPSANPHRSPERPLQQESPPPGEEATTTSRLESVRKSCSLSGISDRASVVIAAGWRKETNTAYQSGWTKWSGWCSARNLNPLSCSVHFFLDFLTELFDSGLQHRTINVIRSAVSMTHEHVEGVPIGQHPMVTRLMKGVYNLRPPRPRYTYTWDADMVIQYLERMGDNADLALKNLSQKLVLLMALATASRTSELQALDLRFRVYRPNGVLFRLKGITKTQSTGSPPKERFFGAFPKKRLCVVECLRAYETMTAGHRNLQSEAQPLFLSYIRPFKPATDRPLDQRDPIRCWGGHQSV